MHLPQELLSIPFPDPHKDYAAILRASCKRIPLADNVDLDEIADCVMERKNNHAMMITPATLAALCREAALESLRHDIDSTHVTKQNFVSALHKMLQ